MVRVDRCPSRSRLLCPGGGGKAGEAPLFGMRFLRPSPHAAVVRSDVGGRPVRTFGAAVVRCFGGLRSRRRAARGGVEGMLPRFGVCGGRSGCLGGGRLAEPQIWARASSEGSSCRCCIIRFHPLFFQRVSIAAHKSLLARGFFVPKGGVRRRCSFSSVRGGGWCAAVTVSLEAVALSVSSLYVYVCMPVCNVSCSV